jgi:hypothetical protein
MGSPLALPPLAGAAAGANMKPYAYVHAKSADGKQKMLFLGK